MDAAKLKPPKEANKMNTTTISTAAFQAIYAAEHYEQWGRFAAFEYARKRGITGLFTRALQLKRMQAAENMSYIG